MIQALAAVALGTLVLAGCGGPARTAHTPLGFDGHGRPTVGVTVNGKGPFPFILDTGAERSMVQHGLAERVGLGALAHVGVNVQGTAGNEKGRMFLADRFAGDLFARRFEPLFELPSAGITEADGILGMNVFHGARLALDFRAATAAVGPSGPAPAGFVSLPARIARGDLALVVLRVDSMRVNAMIDTGARRTLGNLALARALGLSPGGDRFVPTAPVTGASRDSALAWAATVGAVTAGEARFEHPVLAFSDAPVFGRLFPEGGPALILGIDLLHTLDGLAIDYPRAEVQLRAAGAR